MGHLGVTVATRCFQVRVRQLDACGRTVWEDTATYEVANRRALWLILNDLFPTSGGYRIDSIREVPA